LFNPKGFWLRSEIGLCCWSEGITNKWWGWMNPATIWPCVLCMSISLDYLRTNKTWKIQKFDIVKWYKPYNIKLNWILYNIVSIYYRMLKIAQLISVESIGTFQVLLHSLNYLSTTNSPPIMHFLYLYNSTLMSFVSGWSIPLPISTSYFLFNALLILVLILIQCFHLRIRKFI